MLLPSCWLQPDYGPESQGFNPLEESFTSANVDSLTEAWQVEPPAFGTPLVRGGRVLLGGTRGADDDRSHTTTAALSLDDGTTLWWRELFSTTSMSAETGAAVVGDELWVGHLPAGDPPTFATSRHRLDVDTGDTVGSLVDDGYTLVPVDAGTVLADTTQFGFTRPIRRR